MRLAGWMVLVLLAALSWLAQGELGVAWHHCGRVTAAASAARTGVSLTRAPPNPAVALLLAGIQEHKCVAGR
jgi:hypothetical protein